MIVICSMRLPRAAPAQLDDCRSPSADVMKPRWDEHQDIIQAVPSVERRSFLFASLCPRREEPPVTGLDHDPLPLLVHSKPTRSEMAVARDSDPSRLAALLVVATPQFMQVHRQPPRTPGPAACTAAVGAIMEVGSHAHIQQRAYFCIWRYP